MKKNIKAHIRIDVEDATHCRTLCVYCKPLGPNIIAGIRHGDAYYCEHFDDDIPNLERSRFCIESEFSRDDDDLIAHLRNLLAESDLRFKELHAKVETALFIEDHKESIAERRRIIEWINSL